MRSAVLLGVVLAFLALMPAHTPATQAALLLVAGGKSPYRIVLPVDAIPSERYAADELQHYIRIMTGVRLPIYRDDSPATAHEIVLGASARLHTLNIPIDPSPFGEEGCVIRTAGTRLCIVGGRPRGTLYGVYTLLEEYCGVRWFTPQVESVPRHEPLTLPDINTARVPIFEYREVYWTEALGDADFAARLRLNGDHYALAEQHGGRGVDIFPFVHTLDGLIPRDLYNEHPEFFPLVDGKRVRDHAQRCLSNPEVLAWAIARVREWILDEQEATIISISQTDGGHWCRCPDCRALEEAEGSASASLVRFVNRIAEALEAEFPHMLFETLAYQHSRTPPATIRPRRNVVIRLCSNDCCFAHPIASCQAAPSRAFCDDLVAWSKITDRLYIWDYTTNFHGYLQPFPNLGVLQDNIRTFARHGVRGVFAQGNYSPGGGGELAPLRTYLLARLLWNPDLDMSRETRAFLDAYYGKAAPSVAAYLTLLHQQVQDPHTHAFIDDPPTAAYLRPSFLTEARRWLETAVAQADDDAIRFRVQQVQLSLWAIELEADYARGIRHTDLFRQFFAIARKAGITHISEAITLDELARHVGVE
jgi:hypothetical protein